MARRAGGCHPRRDGAHQPSTDSAREGTDRTVRNPAAADGQSRGQAGGKSESPPGEDGVFDEWGMENGEWKMRTDKHSLLIPPGYKQTEVGVIPWDWEIRPLGQLGSWRGGTTPSMRNSAFWANGTI